MNRHLTWLIVLLMFNVPAVSHAQLIENTDSAGAFPIVSAGQTATIYVDEKDFAGVIRAAGDLGADIGRVSGIDGGVVQATGDFSAAPILVGTLGQSRIIDQLVDEQKIDVAPIAGQWESFLIEIVNDPAPGVERALVIAGSDKRGTIYGIYEVSEQMGVSPWYWWADVPVERQEAVFAKAERLVQGPPKVKYRGIFINDEEPAFGPWAREKFGGVNSEMYAHMFELILRLRGNYLWPAMWGKAFNEDDPLSPGLADEYGIVMGTSHHEPMLRAQREWTTHRQGEWNYATNEEFLKEFWRFGVERNKDFESIITIGMRGDGDEPMVRGGDMADNIALLEEIVAEQRQIIAETVNPDVTQVPQLWALYKEVADYYAHGMRVPDDVTLLWCDDNWGNIRRLPTPAERQRSGGAGIYYHFDYVGSPRSYKWLNTNPLPKVWEQMNLAYHYGADRIWIVNAGDLKPMEVPIEFFLEMAWDPQAMGKEQIDDFTRRWAEREFGPEHAREIADIVSRYAKYNGWRKPELLEPTTFSLVNYLEAERVLAGWQEIVAEAERIYAELPEEYRDAYFQLVLYPTKASATVAELHIATGRNRLYAQQGRASANDHAQRVRDLFALDQELTDAYHALNGGKWNHMMVQTRIGYRSWRDPRTNVMPELTELEIPQAASLGVAVEGSESAWPGGEGDAVLPTFDSINRQRAWVDVFNRGRDPLGFVVTTDQPWINVSKTSGEIEKDERLWVSIDWTAVPVSEAHGTITIARPQGESVAVTVNTMRSSEFTRDSIRGAFGGLTGPVAFAAESAMRNIEANGVRWERIPDYGRRASGMSIFPVTAETVMPPQDAPRLEYRVLIPRAGEVHVDLITGPTLDFVPDRGLRLAVSFDDEAPQVVDAFEKQSFDDPNRRPDPSSPAIRDWSDWVRDNARTLRSTHTIAEPGVHTLKVRMVDPGVVLEKLIVHRNDLPESYFGPPAQPAARRFSAAVPSERRDRNSRIAHQQLVNKARSGRIDLYFLGDSITRRWGSTDPQWSENMENWQQNFFGWNAGNFGWGADGIQHVLWRVQNGELDGVNPKVIVISAGTNNIGSRPGNDEKIADILKGMQALVQTCREKAPDAKIILTAIFPRNDNPAVLPEIERVNDGLEAMADGETVFYLNVNDKLADEQGTLYEGMTIDRLHLSPSGYQVWADGLEPLLLRFLGPRAETDQAPPATGDPSIADQVGRR